MLMEGERLAILAPDTFLSNIFCKRVKTNKIARVI